MKTKLPLLASMLFFSLSFSQISLVKDINPGSGDGVAVYNQNRIAYNGKLVFGAGDGTTGNELWISDGTPSGTTLIREILNSSAVGGSNPQKFYDFGGALYFSARRPASNSSGTVGHQLYATDGTNVGTNINFPTLSIQGNSNPANFIKYNNELVFTAKISNSTIFLGEKLLAFNGNPWPPTNYGETIMVGGADLDPEHIIEFNGVLLYNAFTSTNGRELWQSNALSSGIFMDINLGSSDSNPINLTLFNNKLYFSADDGSNGRELWETDGTVSGTQIVTDLYAGVQGSSPSNLTVHNNRLYFTASHSTLGNELFYVGTNGNVTSASNINPGAGSSNPSNLKSFNGKLYFTADNGVNGVELWQSSGTSFTTIMLKDINTSASSIPSGFTEYNSKLYFSADDGSNGRELWVTDGTNGGTNMVANTNASGSFNPTDLIVANNLLFFSADDGSGLGSELWRYLDPTLSIDSRELQNVALVPNPTIKGFSVKGNLNILKIDIYDIQGKRIKSFVENEMFYNTKELLSGIYLVKIQTDKGSATKKLIIE